MDLDRYRERDLRKLIKNHGMYHILKLADPSFRGAYKLYKSGVDGKSDKENVEFLKHVYRRLERAEKAIPYLCSDGDE